MLRTLTIIVFVILSANCANGQERGYLRPLLYEATDIGDHYRDHYLKLTDELSNYPLARTFKHSLYSDLTSIEKTENENYILYYRGYVGRFKMNFFGDTIGYRKAKKIIKTEIEVDSVLALTLQKVFKIVISDTRYHDKEIIMTHEYYCYFYTWIFGQGNIAGKAQYHIFNPLYERLIGLHDSLVEYVTNEASRKKEREQILSTSREILEMYH